MITLRGSPTGSWGKKRTKTGLVLTIGSFDGVHTGHQHLIRKMINWSRHFQKPSAVLTFDPHPCRVLKERPQKQLLGSLKQKKLLLSKMGLDFFLVQPFSLKFARLQGGEFIHNVVTGFRPFMICVGGNFRFGFEGKGDVRLLKTLGRRYGFKVRCVKPLMYGGQTVSSSRVRASLRRGHLQQGARLLGRVFSFQGEKESGSGRGGTLGFPTLNLKPSGDAGLLPKKGVYVVRVKTSEKKFEAVMNIGTRPTFHSEKRGEGGLPHENPTKVEVHLLHGACCPQSLPLSFRQGGGFSKKRQTFEVEVLKFLRKERRFASPSLLVRQIEQDVQKAKQYFQKK